VKDHANHFVGLVEELMGQYKSETGRYGIIASNYDTELFGHWWFEGVDWLKHVLIGLAQSKNVDLTTASTYVDEHNPDSVIALPESSWGMGGNHFTWLNVDTQWMWGPIHEAERRMEALVDRFPDATSEQKDLLNQTARELLLLQSSDWPFLVTTGQAKEYASQRFSDHLERFNTLAELAESGEALGDNDRERLAALVEQDNPFDRIDYRNFAARQGHAELVPQ
jgi:1,4-alpha-glucan branching enzyme